MPAWRRKGLRGFFKNQTDFFSAFIPSIALFHYSIIPCVRQSADIFKHLLISTSCRISETFSQLFPQTELTENLIENLLGSRLTDDLA